MADWHGWLARTVSCGGEGGSPFSRPPARLLSFLAHQAYNAPLPFWFCLSQTTVYWPEYMGNSSSQQGQSTMLSK